MKNDKFRDVTKLISSNWKKVNFLETEIEPLKSFGFFHNNKKIKISIEEDFVKVEKAVKKYNEQGCAAFIKTTIKTTEKEYYITTSPFAIFGDSHFKTESLAKALDYLLFAFVVPGEKLTDEKVNKATIDLEKRWRKVSMLEKELKFCESFEIEVDEKKVRVVIEKETVEFSRDVGRKPRIAKLKKGYEYLVSGFATGKDPYARSFPKENLKEAITWAIESRVVPNCGARAVDKDFDVREFLDKKHNSFASGWEHVVSGLGESLYFIPSNSSEGLMFDIRGQKAPARFRIPIPLESIREIEQTLLDIPLPCCENREAVIIKGKRTKYDDGARWLYQGIALAHPVGKVNSTMANQMKTLLSKYEIGLTLAQLKKTTKEFVGLVSVSGMYDNGNMDYSAVWQEKNGSNNGRLIFEPLISSGKIEDSWDVDKVQPIMSRIGHGNVGGSQTKVRLMSALESVRKQAGQFVYQTHTLDVLGVG
jgi:hypothetical protein